MAVENQNEPAGTPKPLNPTTTRNTMYRNLLESLVRVVAG
jgi:hypothetical protein